MKTKPSAKPVEYEAWGYVVVTKGRFAGRIGYYDDDDTTRTAIVYLDGGLAGAPPLLSPYELIPRSSLRQATPAEAKEYQARNQNELSHARAKKKILDSPSRR